MNQYWRHNLILYSFANKECVNIYNLLPFLIVKLNNPHRKCIKKFGRHMDLFDIWVDFDIF